MFLNLWDSDLFTFVCSLLLLLQVALIVMGGSRVLFSVFIFWAQLYLIRLGDPLVNSERRVENAKTLARVLTIYHRPPASRVCHPLYQTNVAELDMVRWHCHQEQQRQDTRPPAFELTYDWDRNEVCLTDQRSGAPQRRSPPGPRAEPGIMGVNGVSGCNGATFTINGAEGVYSPPDLHAEPGVTVTQTPGGNSGNPIGINLPEDARAQLRRRNQAV